MLWLVFSFLSLLARHPALMSSKTVSWKPSGKQKLKCLDFLIFLAETGCSFQPCALCRQSLLKSSHFQRPRAKQEVLWEPFGSEVTFPASAGSLFSSAVLGGWCGPIGDSVGSTGMLNFSVTAAGPLHSS